MQVSEHEVVVIGSGCAGYNCADTLYEYGVKDVCIVTEGITMGTSRNTGSDKQTYYKLSLSGDEGDSVTNMAKTLFDGGAVDGDIAFCEAANSAASFFKLVRLGMEFPVNEYGEYVGYKTDHDPVRRATSIGPYTSKKMVEVLESAVLKKSIKIYDNSRVVAILTCGGKAVGVLCVNTHNGTLSAIKAQKTVLATGGPSGVYLNSVYPVSQTGASALALNAGAEFVNLSEWQYGLASTDFRWNVSGTYQQVLPRYISVDSNGVEREFLTEHFQNNAAMLKNIFLKGYEWPFDVRKIRGSSYIDLLVYRESVILGRDVYLDFTREPSGMEGGFENLDSTVYEYLKNSDALISKPINRLKKMNEGAIELYKAHGIDITKQPLKIAVCAQHNNGGVLVDDNWQSSVKHLYVCGEAAGTFGIFRPGGTALNSTQVGSMRAARHIAYYADNNDCEGFEEALNNAVGFVEDLRKKCIGKKSTVLNTRLNYQAVMSERFAFIRKAAKMLEGADIINKSMSEFTALNKISDYGETAELIINREILLMQQAIAEYMINAANRYGSRGSAFVTDGDFTELSPVPENEAGRGEILTVKKKNGEFVFKTRSVRPLPERELWFEKVWNKYKNDTSKRSKA